MEAPDIRISVTKLIDASLMRKACSFTMGGKVSNAALDLMYLAEHSPIRTQVFWVEMINIPTFVSVHMVRHKIGVEHFVKSNRDDRGGDGKEDRDTPVCHAMFINAQALIFMSRMRLCQKAHATTIRVWRMVKDAVWEADPALAQHMVPNCEYRGRCTEMKSCGKQPKIRLEDLYL